MMKHLFFFALALCFAQALSTADVTDPDANYLPTGGASYISSHSSLEKLPFGSNDEFSDSPALEFHYHVYFFQNNEQSTADAQRLRQGIVDAVKRGEFVAVCHGVDESVLPGFNSTGDVPPVNMGPMGPHPAGSFEVWVPAEHLGLVTSFMMLNRGETSLLLHPLTRHCVEDHSGRIMWMGVPFNIDLTVLAVDDSYFSFYEKVGTTSTSSSDSIFKIQHYTPSSRSRLQGPPGPSDSGTEEWHGNGVTLFTTSDGTAVLAITHRQMSEAVLLSDPWRIQGGGAVLQRFGNPKIYNAAGKSSSSHVFGMSDISSASWNGVHNVRYSASASGRESVTIFVNDNGSGSSALYEFDLNLVSESSLSSDADDSVFDTPYTYIELPFSTGSQGGARPIGSGDADLRTYVVANGGAREGIFVVDENGDYQQFNPDSVSVYDPFLFFRV